MFVCPDLRSQCLCDSTEMRCPAVKRGISFSIPDDRVLRKLCGRKFNNFPLKSLAYPLVVNVDVGYCTKYETIVEDCKIVEAIESIFQNNSQNKSALFNFGEGEK